MLRLAKPSDRDLERFLQRQSRLPFNYPDVGMIGSGQRRGYEHDSVRARLGNGPDTFAEAKAAIQHWRPFDVGWAEALPVDTPIEPNANIAIQANVWGSERRGLWALAACRIIHVIDEPSRFGFSFGTLPDHPEQGEEQFLVEEQPDGSVWYEVVANFRANTVLAKLGWPYLYRLFNGFRRDSAKRMVQQCER